MSCFSDYEVSLMEQAAVALISDIEMGKSFVLEQQKNGKMFERDTDKRKSISDWTIEKSSDIEENKSEVTREEEEYKRRTEEKTQNKLSRLTDVCKSSSNKVKAKAIVDSKILALESGGRKNFFLGSLWTTKSPNTNWKFKGKTFQEELIVGKGQALEISKMKRESLLNVEKKKGSIQKYEPTTKKKIG